MKGRYSDSERENDQMLPSEEGKSTSAFKLIPLADGVEEMRGPMRSDVTGNVSEDSEPDFVDIREMKSWKGSDGTSQRQETFVNNLPATNCDVTDRLSVKSAGLRSSMKVTSQTDILRPSRSKRPISFDLHDRKSFQVKPQVTIQESKNSRLRHLFTTSRWSTSSSETDSSLRKEDNGTAKPTLERLNDVTPKTSSASSTTVTTNVAFRTNIASLHLPDAMKSRSLQPKVSIKMPSDDEKKRHSTGQQVNKHMTSLRDSAIDLVSDEENSEVYTAVSLAGTLSRKMQPVPAPGFRKKHVILGTIVSFIVTVLIVVTLLIILLVKK